MSELPSLLEAAAAIRRGELQPSDLVERCLAQVARLDAQVQAWVRVDAEGARAAARQLDAEATAGQFRGLLHGIPLGVKDIFDVAGWPTEAGAPLRKGRLADRDAPTVARLRAAGAILLGKTVTTEFASFDPPPTRNPWDLTRTPGGSSSGSAAAVASGMCLAALGSQTGGSITRPASYCGVAGVKPTYGRITAEGVVALAWSMDHPGALARTAGDCAAVLSAMADEATTDPWSAGAHETHFTALLNRAAPPRLGVLGGLFREQAGPVMAAAFEQALARLRSGGAELVPVEPPEQFADVTLQHRRIMAVEAAAYHREDFPARRSEYGPCIASLLDEAPRVAAVEYALARQRQLALRGQMHELARQFDALIMPATNITAPTAETTGDPLFNSPWSFVGLPIVSCTCGLADDGLPAAVQLAGPAFAERALFGVAAWCERQFGPPPWPALVQ